MNFEQRLIKVVQQLWRTHISGLHRSTLTRMKADVIIFTWLWHVGPVAQHNRFKSHFKTWFQKLVNRFPFISSLNRTFTNLYIIRVSMCKWITGGFHIQSLLQWGKSSFLVSTWVYNSNSFGYIGMKKKEYTGYMISTS